MNEMCIIDSKKLYPKAELRFILERLFKDNLKSYT